MNHRGFKVYVDVLKRLLQVSPSIEDIKEKVVEYKPLDYRLPVDQAFRDYLLCLILHPDVSKDKIFEDEIKPKLRFLLNTAVSCARQDLCNGATPLQLFSTLFNCVTIQRCEECFPILEECIPQIKDPKIFTNGRNMLLRMCNDILRRLSKSQNTTFCGRIQLFLSRLFPLDERSGLNIVGRFNSDNVTPYSEQPDELALMAEDVEDIEKEMEATTEEVAQFPVIDMLYKRRDSTTSSAEQIERPEQIKVSGELYLYFWSLQDFFRNPNISYEASKWDKLVRCTEEVLHCFERYKLDSHDVSQALSKGDTHFTKYLTSERLLNLELMDSTFRRYILVQLLILFQYFTVYIRTRNESHKLSDEKKTWLKAISERVQQQLIPDTPPEGHAFMRIVTQILKEEEFWSAWKNEQPPCPTFILPLSADQKDLFMPIERKRPVNTLVDRNGRRICRFTSPEMTALWQQEGSNIEVVKHPKHLFRYDHEEYFQDAIQQLDPDEKVEETDRLVNSEEWSWRAFRLITREDPSFVKLKHIADSSKSYLTNCLQKMGEEMGLLNPKVEPLSASQMASQLPEKNETDEDYKRENSALKRTKSSMGDTTPLKQIKIENGEHNHIVNINEEIVAEQGDSDNATISEEHSQTEVDEVSESSEMGPPRQNSRHAEADGHRRLSRHRSRRLSVKRNVRSDESSSEEDNSSESEGEGHTSEIVEVVESAY